MYLTARKIKNLPVVTKSGRILGKVKDLEINSETQTISKYLVKSDKLMERLIDQELLIDAGQVISLTEKELVVDDAVVKDVGLARESVAVS